MTCPLCSADADLIAIDVDGGPFGAQAEVCALCAEQIAGEPDANHWRGLASAMWSEEPAVQVIAARMLKRLSGEGWAQDLAEQLYLDDETQAWADNVAAASDHKDANGATGAGRYCCFDQGSSCQRRRVYGQAWHGCARDQSCGGQPRAHRRPRGRPADCYPHAVCEEEIAPLVFCALYLLLVDKL